MESRCAGSVGVGSSGITRSMAKYEVLIVVHGHLRGPFEVELPEDAMKEALQYGTRVVTYVQPPAEVRKDQGDYPVLVGVAHAVPEQHRVKRDG